MRQSLCFYALFSLLLLLIGLPAQGQAAGTSPEAIFQKANAAYRGSDYPEAASLYESLLEKGWRNAAVYYNLGNAYFKQQQLGKAILNYESSRRLDPRDRDVLSNLEFANGLLEYKIEDKRNWYLKKADALLQTFTQEEIGMMGLGTGFVFLLSWIFSLHFRPADSWGWKRKMLFLMTLICLSLWGLKGAYGVRVHEAIVMKSKASVRYGPSFKDQIAFRLAEGMKVRVKKKAEDWIQVLLVNGETGWMSQEEIAFI